MDSPPPRIPIPVFLHSNIGNG